METTISPASRPLYRGTQVIWYLLWLLEVVLGLRFLLKLFGANPYAGFSSFIYALSYPFAAPFLNVFKISVVAGSVFEWTTLLAMLIYWLVAWAIVRLLLMGKPVSSTEAAVKLERQDNKIN